MKENLAVRKVNKSDVRRIWEIRNTPEARHFSNSPEEISFSKHNAWFKKRYFLGENNHCFVLEDTTAGGVIGYCRFDFDEDEKGYTLSVALDPVFHGRGLGGLLLKESLAKFSGTKLLLAEIQKNNTPSLKIFQKNGFAVFKEDDKNYYLRNEIEND